MTAVTATDANAADAMTVRTRTLPPGANSTHRLTSSSCEQVGRAGVAHRAVVLVPVDAFGAAVLAARADEHRSAVPTERNRASEFVRGSRVRALDEGLLDP